jgi:hypothetical protein
MKAHYDNNNYEVMVKNTKTYKKQIEEIKAKKLEEAKKLKEETIQKEQLLAQKDQLLSNKDNILNEKDQEIEALRASIAQKELEKQELLTQTEHVSTVKDQLLADKDREMQSLREELVQKDREREELRVEKNLELANKSLVKNQLINELQDDIGLKEKEALNLKIESLIKQLELKDKQVEFHKKESADAHLINELKVKEAQDKSIINKIKAKQLDDLITINELKGQILTLEGLYNKGQGIQNIELKALKAKVDKTILSEKMDDIEDISKLISIFIQNNPINESMTSEQQAELSRQISEFMNNEPVDNDNSFGFLKLLNESPIPHVMEKSVQHPIAFNNFDIENQHITHSVLLSGSVEVSIIEDGSI